MALGLDRPLVLDKVEHRNWGGGESHLMCTSSDPEKDQFRGELRHSLFFLCAFYLFLFCVFLCCSLIRTRGPCADLPPGGFIFYMQENKRATLFPRAVVAVWGTELQARRGGIDGSVLAAAQGSGWTQCPALELRLLAQAQLCTVAEPRGCGCTARACGRVGAVEICAE